MNKVWESPLFSLVSLVLFESCILTYLTCSQQIFVYLMALMYCLLTICSAKKMKHSTKRFELEDEVDVGNNIKYFMGRDVDTFDGDDDDNMLFTEDEDELLFSDPLAYRPFCKTDCRTFMGFPVLRLACRFGCELLRL